MSDSIRIYMTDHETIVVRGSYTSAKPYDQVLLTKGLLSAITLEFGLILKGKTLHAAA